MVQEVSYDNDKDEKTKHTATVTKGGKYGKSYGYGYGYGYESSGKNSSAKKNQAFLDATSDEDVAFGDESEK